MTDPQDVRALIEQASDGRSKRWYQDTLVSAVDELAREWLTMHEELERIADMDTDSAAWYQRRARIGLGLEGGEDD